MSVIQSSGLHLLVGDGGSPETYLTLAGSEVKRLEIGQALLDGTAIAMDSWAVGVATTDRRAVVECTALATDSAAAARVRYLAVSGVSGHFKLEVSPTEALLFEGFVLQYREDIQAGSMKRMRFRLESSGAISFG